MPQSKEIEVFAFGKNLQPVATGQCRDIMVRSTDSPASWVRVTYTKSLVNKIPSLACFNSPCPDILSLINVCTAHILIWMLLTSSLIRRHGKTSLHFNGLSIRPSVLWLWYFGCNGSRRNDFLSWSCSIYDIHNHILSVEGGLCPVVQLGKEWWINVWVTAENSHIKIKLRNLVKVNALCPLICGPNLKVSNLHIFSKRWSMLLLFCLLAYGTGYSKHSWQRHFGRLKAQLCNSEAITKDRTVMKWYLKNYESLIMPVWWAVTLATKHVLHI